MLAVYSLLEEHFGVRWFWPGDSGEHVPQNATITVPEFDIRRQPAFEIRSITLGSSTYRTKKAYEEGRKWCRRSRLAWVKFAIFGHSWDAAFELRKGESFLEHPDWFLAHSVERPVSPAAVLPSRPKEDKNSPQ